MMEWLKLNISLSCQSTNYQLRWSGDPQERGENQANVFDIQIW